VAWPRPSRDQNIHTRPSLLYVNGTHPPHLASLCSARPLASRQIPSFDLVGQVDIVFPFALSWRRCMISGIVANQRAPSCVSFDTNPLWKEGKSGGGCLWWSSLSCTLAVMDSRPASTISLTTFNFFNHSTKSGRSVPFSAIIDYCTGVPPPTVLVFRHLPPSVPRRTCILVGQITNQTSREPSRNLCPLDALRPYLLTWGYLLHPALEPLGPRF
jgi:hypothetical protein